MGVHPTPGFTANAFIWHNGVTTDLGVPPGATATTANAINNRGDACGFAVWPDPATKFFVRRACAWIDGEFIDLGILAPGYSQSIAYDINDAREIVGTCFDGPGPFTSPGWIWRDGVMTSLAELLPDGPVSLIATGSGINNRGQITGEGIFDDPEGDYSVALLLTPALPPHAGDANCDDAVNVNDLLQVIVHWNPAGPVGGNPADLNRDNMIDQLDIVQVIMHWD